MLQTNSSFTSSNDKSIMLCDLTFYEILGEISNGNQKEKPQLVTVSARMPLRHSCTSVASDAFCRGSKASSFQMGDYITIKKVVMPLFFAIFVQP